MRITYNPNGDPNVPHIIEVTFDMKVRFEFPGDGCLTLDPFRMTWGELMQRPYIQLLVKTSNGARLLYETGELLEHGKVLFLSDTPPTLPHTGTSLMRVVSMGNKTAFICDVVLDLK